MSKLIPNANYPTPKTSSELDALIRQLPKEFQALGYAIAGQTYNYTTLNANLRIEQLDKRIKSCYKEQVRMIETLDAIKASSNLIPLVIAEQAD